MLEARMERLDSQMAANGFLARNAGNQVAKLQRQVRLMQLLLLLAIVLLIGVAL